jgi:predicted nuclease of predicted toxin-antitoxin system
VNFLIDNSLSPVFAENLRLAGHDSVQVRRYGIHKADDEVIFDRAAEEVRVLVSAGTDFGTILTTRQGAKPSVILFGRESAQRPEAQAGLLWRIYRRSPTCSIKAALSSSKRGGYAAVYCRYYAAAESESVSILACYSRTGHTQS